MDKDCAAFRVRYDDCFLKKRNDKKHDTTIRRYAMTTIFLHVI